MRKRATIAAAAAMIGVTLFSATSASAVSRTMYTPDKYAWGSIQTFGDVSAPLVTVRDIGADGRGPTIYYKIGANGTWASLKNGTGSGTSVSTYPSVAASPGTVISFYVCNANTNTGYSSCSDTLTFTG